MTAATVAALYAVQTAPIPMWEKVAALEAAAEAMRELADEAERAELELLWAQS